MKRIAQQITDLIGNTPLIELHRFAPEANIIAKLESFNPSSSVKDRLAKALVEDGERRGVLNSNTTIIEPTSGNTGIGLAMVAASRGYKLILTMPETMSIERRKLLSALGAQLVLTPGAEGMKGAIKRADELNAEIENSAILRQFENRANPEVHYHTTAEEVWLDTDGEVDILIAGVGTGGTISGTGKRLKELNPSIEVIAVEPASSPVLTEGRAGAHKIQGIGAGFVPKTYDSSVVDRVITVENDEAFAASRNVALSEGVLVGISSGAALHAAQQVASQEENRDKMIVVILPDSGERYLSTELY
ncbi:MAG: cysteine synthase A [Rikenellaceae bacterium]